MRSPLTGLRQFGAQPALWLLTLFIAVAGSQSCYRTIIKVEPGSKYQTRELSVPSQNQTTRFVSTLFGVIQWDRTERIACRKAVDYIRLERGIVDTLLYGAFAPGYSPWGVEVFCQPVSNTQFLSGLIDQHPKNEKLKELYNLEKKAEIARLQGVYCPKPRTALPVLSDSLKEAYIRLLQPANAGETLHIMRVKDTRTLTEAGGVLTQKATAFACLETLQDRNDPTRCRIREPSFVRRREGRSWGQWAIDKPGQRDDALLCANMK